MNNVLPQLVKNTLGDLSFNVLSLQAEIVTKNEKIKELEAKIADLELPEVEAINDSTD